MESPREGQKRIKGVILAGGLGTRLRPLTLITNKHLLPVYDRPMILYPIQTLRESGIEDILLVTGREHAGHFMNFLGSGKEFGVRLSYAVQDKNNAGIADALAYAEDFADGDNVAVILGDNIFLNAFKEEVRKFTKGVCVFLKKVADPGRYGVAVFDKSGTKILRIEEKPKRPKSNYAQTGFYLLDNTIFSHIKTLAPSPRGELEMTDAINCYKAEGSPIRFAMVKGGWYDAGTIDSLLQSAADIRKQKSKTKS